MHLGRPWQRLPLSMSFSLRKVRGDRQTGLGFDPDVRVQEAVHHIFARFRALGSARQVLPALTEEQLCFPRPSDGRTMVSFDWTPIRYRNVIAVLKNPFYAGIYRRSPKRPRSGAG